MNQIFNLSLLAAVAFSAGCVGLCPTGVASVTDAGELLKSLDHPELNESSGLARGGRGLIWTQNDSGDSARLFAFTEKGHFRGVVDIDGANAIDWEDCTSLQRDGQDWLIAADTGDNKKKRPYLSLYLFPEPVPEQRSCVIQQRVDFRYEDGAFDCEAIWVDPDLQRAWLVTKKKKKSGRLYYLDIAPSEDRSIRTAHKVPNVKLPSLVTSADISADGRYVVLCTYGDAYEFQRTDAEEWSSALQRQPKLIKLPWRKQGEAVCYSADGKCLLISSEGLPAAFHHVPLNR